MLRRLNWTRGLALSAALCLSLILAACQGPTVVEGTGKAGPYDVALKIDPPTMQAGQKATLNYLFTDPAAGGKPVTNLATLGGTPLQVFVMDRQLGYFKHDPSPGLSAINSYPVNVLFGREGTYHVFAEFAPTMVVTDTAGRRTNQPGDTIVYPSTISFGTAGRVEEEPAPLNEDTRPKTVGGVTIAMTPTTPLRAQAPATFTFHLSELGVPIHTLATYLGAAGHMIALDQEALHFTHLFARESEGLEGGESGQGGEPTEGMGTGAESGNASGETGPAAGTATPGLGIPTPIRGATPTEAPTQVPGVYIPLPTAPPSTSLGGGTFGPTITFEHEFEEPGLYKVWGQFLYRGQVLTAEYVVNVQP